MKIDNLVLLLEKGFSKDEIMALCGEAAASAPAEPVPAAQPEEPAAPAQPEPAAAQPADDRLNKLETKLDYAINRLNYMAVQSSQQPAQQQESVDDILASVVRGFEKEK
jgi:hypothetical protein